MKRIFCLSALELFHCLLQLFCEATLKKATKCNKTKICQQFYFTQYNRSSEKVAQAADPLPSILHAYLVSQLACFNNSHFPGRCALRVSSCHTQLVSVILLPTDKRTDVQSRPLCIYTQVFSPQKTWFFPHISQFPISILIFVYLYSMQFFSADPKIFSKKN